MTDLQILGQQAKTAASQMALLNTKTKNQLLEKMAETLELHTEDILQANQLDLNQAKENEISEVLQNRLQLTEKKIKEMTNGIRLVAHEKDPIGQIDKTWENEDGLIISQKRVPLGVIGVIYESRPNVTTDVATLCFKAGNAVILRGGKESFHSNQLLVSLLQETLENNYLSPFIIQFVDDTSRKSADELMQLTEYLDVLIPRGGNNLIQHVKEHAKVPVIETGTGNNHVYIDKAAQINMAADILVNAKVQNPSVCNACETLLIHKEVAAFFLPVLEERLQTAGVALHADERAMDYLTTAIPATQEDWSTEYLDYILAVKVVDSLEDAISHINRYNTKHSETIVTDNYFAAQKFLNEVDAAAVYVNASTRFTDGFVFGFGAEVGISTQKLHARGPMGLLALTSTKYVICGNGQIRE
ncbi:MAG TPA: glutamate-5-semialdehyde dehydrogenase [Tetragenococcus sp.]|nr:glutamate-5-semialdehyde dehydrogenase [Tetragenococcus sp.]